MIVLWCLLKVKACECDSLEIMIKKGLRIVAVLTNRYSYFILLALNINDGDENVLHDGHLRVRVMSTFKNLGIILIGVDGSRLLCCHDVISIYIPLGISNLDVGTTRGREN